MTTNEKMEMKNIEKGKTEDEDIKAPDSWFGVRHTQMILLFTLINIAYGMRVNLSVGIVAMTDPKTNPDHDFPTYEWRDKSIILSSFFWGYIIPQVMAGQLSKRYGPRWFLIVSMAVCSLFTLLIPCMASFGSWGVMICRFVQGLAQGFFFPGAHSLLSKWAPKPERSRLGTFVFAGGPFGTVMSLPITGYMSASSYGWPSAFYLYGMFGFAWVLAYLCFGSNSPAEHKTIDPEEKYYIEATLGHTEHRSQSMTPWKSFATSLPVWAILVTHCAQNWGFWTLLTEIPLYMSHVLNFNIKSNGLLSALPYFTMWIMSFFFSWATDYIINKKYVSIGSGRKIANSVALFGPAIALVLLGIFGTGADSKVLAIALLIIGVTMNAAHMCGYQVNHIDLSPNHAGTLMGITNGGSNIFSLMGPLFVQHIVTDEKDVDQWKIVFFVAAAIFVIGDLFYIFFASGEKQTWDSEESSTENAETSVTEKKPVQNNSQS